MLDNNNGSQHHPPVITYTKLRLEHSIGVHALEGRGEEEANQTNQGYMSDGISRNTTHTQPYILDPAIYYDFIYDHKRMITTTNDFLPLTSAVYILLLPPPLSTLYNSSDKAKGLNISIFCNLQILNDEIS